MISRIRLSVVQPFRCTTFCIGCCVLFLLIFSDLVLLESQNGFVALFSGLYKYAILYHCRANPLASFPGLPLACLKRPGNKAKGFALQWYTIVVRNGFTCYLYRENVRCKAIPGCGNGSTI